MKARSDVVEKRVRDTMWQCGVGHAQKYGRVMCDVVEILRFVGVGFARVDVKRHLLEKTTSDLCKVACCGCEFSGNVGRTTSNNGIMQRHC